jgi:hypothetical protein
MRSILLTPSVVALLVGCAAPVQTTVPSGPWHYADQVPGCLRFVGDRGQNTQTTVVLEDSLRDSLISKLPADSVPSPQCWYEKPDGSLLLQTGDYCRNPHWVTFVRANGDWQVATVEDPFMSCHPKVRS